MFAKRQASVLGLLANSNTSQSEGTDLEILAQSRMKLELYIISVSTWNTISYLVSYEFVREMTRHVVLNLVLQHSSG